VPLDYASVVFAYDGTVIASGGNRYLKDFGPHSLDALFPGGAADPVPQLDGSILFSGAQYASLAGAVQTRFYQVAPTAQFTWLLRLTASNGAVFASWDSTNKGMIVLQTTAGELRLYEGQGGACPYVLSALFPHGRHRAMVTTTEASPRSLLDQSVDNVTWVGAYAAPSHDPTIIPRIGIYPNGTTALTGNLHYLCLMKGSVSSPDLAYASRLLAEGVKPFCWRRP